MEEDAAASTPPDLTQENKTDEIKQEQQEQEGQPEDQESQEREEQEQEQPRVDYDGPDGEEEDEEDLEAEDNKMCPCLVDDVQGELSKETVMHVNQNVASHVLWLVGLVRRQEASIHELQKQLQTSQREQVSSTVIFYHHQSVYYSLSIIT